MPQLTRGVVHSAVEDLRGSLVPRLTDGARVEVAGPTSKRISDPGEAGAPKPGDVIAGKYRVEGIVGSGGMGIVVSALHLQLGQKVAIKVLSVASLESDRQEEARARFLREGQAAARLTSDHVVRIYDVGTTDAGEPFMVMELLRGDDLATILDRSGPAPVDVAIDYIVQACDAVGEAHTHGIVHRDLKPSNLFVSKRNDGRISVKVLDFGISKAVVPGSEHFEGSLTATRTIVGSPYYMSPEQVRDAKRVDTRTDLWSMGMILYELLTGEPAFNADTLPGICAAIAADPAPGIRDKRPEIPEEVEQIVLRCLEKDPAKRFQTVAELVEALEPFLPRAGSPASIQYLALGSLLAARDAPRHSPNQETIDQPSQHTGTLLSPRHSPSGDRVTTKAPVVVLPAGRETPASQEQLAELGSSATLVSGHSSKQGSSSRRSLMIGIAGALLVGVVTGSYVLRSRATPAVVPAATAPARFSLSMESVPSGAQVLDGDRVLGTTPLSIPIDNASVATGPRRFTLRLDGYEPYSVSQGASESSVRVLATLAPVSKPAPVEPGPAEPSRASHRPTLQHPVKARPSTSAGSDIRLQR